MYKVISSLFILLFLMSPLAAAENDLQKLFRQYQEAAAAGKYVEAIEFIKRWQSVGIPRANKKFPAAAFRAVAEKNMAAQYLSLGDYRKAEELSLSAVRNAEQAYGPNHHYVAEVLTSLGNTYNAKGAYGDALKVHLRAMELFKGTDLPKKDRDFGNADHLSNIGNAYTNLGRFREAEEAYKRGLAYHVDVPSLDGRKFDPSSGLATGESIAGRNDRQASLLMNNLAVLFIKQDRFEEAEILLNRAIAIDEKFKGRNHPELSLPINNLANIYFYRGELDKAEPLYRRVADQRPGYGCKGRGEHRKSRTKAGQYPERRGASLS